MILKKLYCKICNLNFKTSIRLKFHSKTVFFFILNHKSATKINRTKLPTFKYLKKEKKEERERERERSN